MQPIIKTPPVITVTVNGKTETFNNYYRASGFIHEFIRDEERVWNNARAKEIETNGVNYVYEAKFLLEHKYGLWVATSKEGKYNIRKDGSPYYLGEKRMFALNGKDLIAFYERYRKISLLE